jgi:hypothetical protein
MDTQYGLIGKHIEAQKVFLTVRHPTAVPQLPHPEAATAEWHFP